MYLQHAEEYKKHTGAAYFGTQVLASAGHNNRDFLEYPHISWLKLI